MITHAEPAHHRAFPNRTPANVLPTPNRIRSFSHCHTFDTTHTRPPSTVSRRSTMVQATRFIPRSWISGTKRDQLALVVVVCLLYGVFWYQEHHGDDAHDPAFPWDHPDVAENHPLRPEADPPRQPRAHAEQPSPPPSAVLPTTTEPPPSPPPSPPPPVQEDKHFMFSNSKIFFDRNVGKSCQNYVEKHVRERNLEDSKAECLRLEACQAIECASPSALCSLLSALYPLTSAL